MTEKTVKILMIAPALPMVGGQTVQAQRLFGKLKLEPSIKIDFQPINPAFLRPLQTVKYVKTMVTEIKYVFDLLRKIPFYDVIHIFSAGDSGFIFSTIPPVLAAKLFNKKTILNYRNGGAKEHLETWKKTALPTIKLFDKIVVPSGFLVDVFAEFDLKATSIFNFTDEEKYVFRERKQLQPIFLSNRNFDSLYNISCTIKAFGLIQNKFPEAKLLIVGAGEERLKLENLVKELSLKNVEFYGQISPDKMPEMYNKADIYLNSPNIDNMPNSIIEAFACGIPIVSTNAGGIPYIVKNGETGLLVNVNDHFAMAEKAIELLENCDQAQRISANAHKEVKKYAWEKVREMWLETYLNLSAK